jgi:O-antigen/teichoic acid export membrane protein
MTLKKQIITGAKWTTVATLSIAFSQILRLAILTRFLDKADFGIVAILTFVIGLTQVFGDLGFSVAIIHKKLISNNEFNSIFWTQFLLFLVLYCLLAFCSPLVADFYKEPSISYLMPIALLDLIFWGIGKLYDTLLQKQMKFRKMAIRNIVSSFISLLIAFLLAYFKFGIYSLIFSTLFYTASNNIWNFIDGQKDYRIKLHLSFLEVKPFFMIGIYKTGSQILDYFAGKLDILIIGKIWGIESLGVYNLAKELIFKVISVFQSIITKVGLPLFANNQENIPLLKTHYSKLTQLVSLINFPITACICAFSRIIVHLLYGDRYFEAAPLLSLLSIYAMIYCVSSSVGILVTAAGKTYLDFRWTIIRSIITPIAIFLASFYSMNAVIIGQIIIGLIGFFYTWKYIINKLIFLSLSDYIKSFYRIGIISLVISFIFYFIINDNVLGIENIYFQIGVYGSSFLLLYVFLMYLYMKIQIVELKSLLFK